jgi:hypothetical protein
MSLLSVIGKIFWGSDQSGKSLDEKILEGLNLIRDDIYDVEILGKERRYDVFSTEELEYGILNLYNYEIEDDGKTVQIICGCRTDSDISKDVWYVKGIYVSPPGKLEKDCVYRDTPMLQEWWEENIATSEDLATPDKFCYAANEFGVWVGSKGGDLGKYVSFREFSCMQMPLKDIPQYVKHAISVSK